MRFHQARAILVRHCQEFDGADPSTNKQAYKRPRVGARTEAYWQSNPRPTDDGDTSRLRAYLSAYREIEGGYRISATGIRLDDGFLYPDKGVMKAALQQGLATFDATACEFVITL